MNKQTRFVALLGFLLLGGAVHVHAQMGNHVPTGGGSRPPENNGNVNSAMGGTAGTFGATPKECKSFATEFRKPSAAKEFTISGMAVGIVDLMATEHFEISLEQAGPYSPSLSVGQLPATIWVRLTGRSRANGPDNTVHGNITMSSNSEMMNTPITVMIPLGGIMR